MNNERQEALTIDQWKVLRDTAEDQGGRVSDAVAKVVPFSGIQRHSLAHLRENWIEWRSRGMKITIPAQDDCNDWKTQGGGHGFSQLRRREKPCHYCRTTGETDGFERRPRFKNEPPSSRTVILHEDIAEPAVKFLKEVFKERDRPSMCITPNALTIAANRLFEAAPLDREIRYSSLIRTHVVILAKYNINVSEITSLTPFSEDKVRSIISKTPGLRHDDIQKDISPLEFLQVLERHEPASVYDLMDILDRGRRAISSRLHTLREHERVEIVRNEGYGPNPEIWSTTEPAEMEFGCRHDGCQYRTDSVNGIRQHESRVHESN